MSTRKTPAPSSKAASKGKKAPPDAQALAKNDADAKSKEDRAGRRIPIQLLVDYKAGGSYLFDFCKDLGTGGVFIQTDKPMPTGAAIDLTFTIPDSKETLNTKGTVIWVQAPVENRSDLVPGMGVQFSGFSQDQRRILESFVQRYHGDKKIKSSSPHSSTKKAI